MDAVKSCYKIANKHTRYVHNKEPIVHAFLVSSGAPERSFLPSWKFAVLT